MERFVRAKVRFHIGNVKFFMMFDAGGSSRAVKIPNLFAGWFFDAMRRRRNHV